MESARLRCTVTPGQFTGEYAISAAQSNGRRFSLFADEDFVESDNGMGEGWLSVHVVDHKGDDTLIRLPAQSLEGGQLA